MKNQAQKWDKRCSREKSIKNRFLAPLLGPRIDFWSILGTPRAAKNSPKGDHPWLFAGSGSHLVAIWGPPSYFFRFCLHFWWILAPFWTTLAQISSILAMCFVVCVCVCLLCLGRTLFCWVVGLLCCWVLGFLDSWVVGLLCFWVVGLLGFGSFFVFFGGGGNLFFGLLVCWVVVLWGSWVLGFLVCWVAMFLGCWVVGWFGCPLVVGLLGCWVGGLVGCWVGLLDCWFVVPKRPFDA